MQAVKMGPAHQVEPSCAKKCGLKRTGPIWPSPMSQAWLKNFSPKTTWPISAKYYFNFFLFLFFLLNLYIFRQNKMKQARQTRLGHKKCSPLEICARAVWPIFQAWLVGPSSPYWQLSKSQNFWSGQWLVHGQVHIQ